MNAAGFVLDVPLTGPAEAAERVLDLWCDGARLRELPDGRWLLTLPEPVRVRAGRAPGLPLEGTGRGGLAAPGASDGAASGHLALVRGGVVEIHVVDRLPEVDPSGWLLLTGLTLHRPRPLGVAPAPDAAPVEESLPPRPRPDLRAAAGIRPASGRARRLTSDKPPAGTARRRRRRRRGPEPAVDERTAAVIVVLVIVLPLSMVVLHGLGLLDGHGIDPGGVVVASAVAALAYALLFGRSAARGGGTGTSTDGTSADGTSAEGTRAAAPRRTAPRRLGHLLARLTLRTPAARLLHGRHARYLRDLTRAFEQHRWDDALRDALPLASAHRGGGTTRVWLSLSLPKRFTGALRPTPGEGPAASVSPLSGPTAYQHLSALYRHAAERLEQQGRTDEAAFVLADLLDAPAEAVALLDRHGRPAQAAELAEGRNLPADQVVRLWWRAGEHERAVRTAHRRGVFARAVERLDATDPQAARALRAAWAEHCRAAGDRLGAVEAVWPDAALRPTIAADLRDAVALGGPLRGRALPYLLALDAGDATRALARAVLDGDGDPHTTGRSALAAALAVLPAADAATDRELATAAARAAARDGGFGGALGSGPGAVAERALFDRLLRRADPLTAADLARPRPRPRPPAAALRYTAADRPGTLPVLDAARLASGSLLVACGQAGVRLLAPDGRVRARWDTPADRFVLADHGGSALLVEDHGPELRGFARLDLATRTVRPWTTLRARQLAPSFDGRHLIASDGRELVVLDTLTPRPTVVWRELGGDQRLVGGITRTPGGCAAVVRSPLPDGSPLTEVWRWDLPGWELRGRLRVDDALAVEPLAAVALAAVALAAGSLLTATTASGAAATAATAATATAPGDHTLLCWTSERPDTELCVDGRASAGPAADGDHWALTVPEGADLRVHTGTGQSSAPALTLRFPDAAGPRTGLRHHAGAVTHWHRSGRVLATSADGSALLANLRVTTG
ncbi:bpX6 domain-containing protein [Kitasatospora sp. NPDC015120]|uniref:bpX6 domain-containing protein n=1 Tax=Kitasatospora sp. NPDC015120 TaxID=3364023 RepID=UPI0036F4675E